MLCFLCVCVLRVCVLGWVRVTLWLIRWLLLVVANGPQPSKKAVSFSVSQRLCPRPIEPLFRRKLSMVIQVNTYSMHLPFSTSIVLKDIYPMLLTSFFSFVLSSPFRVSKLGKTTTNLSILYPFSMVHVSNSFTVSTCKGNFQYKERTAYKII